MKTNTNKTKQIFKYLEHLFTKDFPILRGTFVKYKIKSGKKVYSFPYLSYGDKGKTKNIYLTNQKLADEVKKCIQNYKTLKNFIKKITDKNIKILKARRYKKDVIFY